MFTDSNTLIPKNNRGTAKIIFNGEYDIKVILHNRIINDYIHHTIDIKDPVTEKLKNTKLKISVIGKHTDSTGNYVIFHTYIFEKREVKFCDECEYEIKKIENTNYITLYL